MVTSGEAFAPTGDVFNGKTYIAWALLSQDPKDGAHGSSLIDWGWSTSWASGDGCHTIQGGQVTINGSTVYGPVATVHDFNSGHNHTGIWPPGGWDGATPPFKIFHDANGQANVVMSATAHGTSGGNSVASGTWALPDIIQAPLPPTAVAVARVSDTQITVGWTNDNTAHHGYFGMDIQRSTDGGAFANIATVVPGTTSFTDTTTSADHKYSYRVHAFNDAGTADSAPSAAVYTTPGAPTACSAAKLPNNDVLVSWVNNVNYAEYTTRIEESTDGGVNWAEIQSVVGGVTSVAVGASTATTHTYRVRARTTVAPTLNSAYSPNSNTVTLLANANPPTGLAPAGTARDATGAITLTWTHNPADGTPQTKRRVRYKIDAGAFVDAVNDSSGVSSFTLPANTLTNGHTITWNVATAGQNGVLSGFSADAVFTTSAKPTATISAPTAAYNSSHLTVAWTYFQANGSAQATFVAQLYDAGNNLLEQVTGTTAASATFPASVLADATSYTVKVTVASAAGVTSDVASQAFTVAYLPPAAVAVTAAYDAPSGATVLTIVGDPETAGVTVPISTVDVQRSIDGGPWVTFAAGVVLGQVDEVLTATVLDTTPTIAGTNTYRVVALSDLPSSTLSPTVDVVTASPWVFLNSGAGFATVVRAMWQPQVDQNTDPAAAVYHFAGRVKPVMLEGEALDTAFGVSVTLTAGSSTPAELHAMSRARGVVCYRDPFGARVFGRLSGVKTSRTNTRTADASFNITELDHAE